MSVDTKRFRLHRTEVEFDTYYPSEYVFGNITDPLVSSAFEAATERGFNIEKLIKINRIKIDYNGSEIDASAALKHIIDYKFIKCIVLINTDAINDLNDNIRNIVDKCEFLELNGFRLYSIWQDESYLSRNYILVNYDSRLLIRELIFNELIKKKEIIYG